MTIHLVVKWDYDDSTLIAAYASKEDAERHATDLGYGVDQVELFDSYRPDAEAVERHAREVERARLEYEDRKKYDQIRENEAVKIGELRPADVPDKRLCLCRSFDSSGWLRLGNGYCQYCGGWDAAAFSPSELAAAKQNVISREERDIREKIEKATKHIGLESAAHG